ncbi:MAG TPA: hypothetical protein VFC31_14455 [Candidatus Limnocylindria bacterium]|nr:hypothetical protein [Candidatus Limnocylindria bacterium]
MDECDVRRCCMCGLEKPESEFAFRRIATGERQSHCRACHAAYRRQHYLRNRAEYVAREAARIKTFRIENRVKIFEYLSVHPCVDCGETDVLVLEFDHRDPSTKQRDIGFIAARKPWKFVLAEIAKCDVRCANCHRKRTAIQFNWTKLLPPARSSPSDRPQTPLPVQRAMLDATIALARCSGVWRAEACGRIQREESADRNTHEHLPRVRQSLWASALPYEQGAVPGARSKEQGHVSKTESGGDAHAP